MGGRGIALKNVNQKKSPKIHEVDTTLPKVDRISTDDSKIISNTMNEVDLVDVLWPR